MLYCYYKAEWKSIVHHCKTNNFYFVGHWKSGGTLIRFRGKIPFSSSYQPELKTDRWKICSSFAAEELKDNNTVRRRAASHQLWFINFVSLEQIMTINLSPLLVIIVIEQLISDKHPLIFPVPWCVYSSLFGVLPEDIRCPPRPLLQKRILAQCLNPPTCHVRLRDWRIKCLKSICRALK